ncbi:hypothetical protein AUR04nite_33890 [Glutamicibacter uratoxydans]|uniref:N-acetyltransferase domain-containing protein n=1 Tax=Glutamicibacter uratoxydans TaxID=43667 RepID=A0A4Y4DTA6_GLUUR|nr:GNAT family N-acetyltransferase [Glutamicibacter uratoxydans]GED07857.1 hypothetical protein AUR04nite_33890 [Glutamicibacter uratoxydans]
MDLSPTSALGLELIGLEESLLDPAIRSDAAALAGLLHERFEEVGASGRQFSKAGMIDALLTDPQIQPVEKSTRLGIDDPRLLQLSEDCVLLRYQLNAQTASRRSSLWVRGGRRWQLFFHQGTTAPEPRPVDHPAPAPAAAASGAYLRRLHPDDANAVFEAFSSAPDMARQGEVGSLEQARIYIQFLLSAESSQHPLAVCLDAQLVGLVCARIDDTNKNAWVWYWMHAGYRGRGLTSQAVRALAAQLFEDCGMQRLELGLRANNPASKAVAESAGFLLEGVERGKFLIDGERIDVLCYSRLTSDPAPAGKVLAIY